MLKKSKLIETNPNNNTENKSSKGITGRFNDISLLLYNVTIKQVFGYNSLKFYCIYCGKDLKKRKCSRCGSMTVRTR